MRNLRDKDVGHPDAPWREGQPAEPDEWCDMCGDPVDRYDRRTEELDLTTIETEVICPHCNEVVDYFTSDVTEGFLMSVREAPEEMLEQVDNFEELREL